MLIVRLLNLGIQSWAGPSLLWGTDLYDVLFRVLAASSIPLDASNTFPLVMTTKMSPDIPKCPRGAKSPPFKNSQNKIETLCESKPHAGGPGVPPC